MCWHKWTKWEQYDVSMIFYPYKMPGKEIPYIEHRQKRRCLKCGKVQVEKIEV